MVLPLITTVLDLNVIATYRLRCSLVLGTGIKCRSISGIWYGEPIRKNLAALHTYKPCKAQ